MRNFLLLATVARWGNRHHCRQLSTSIISTAKNDGVDRIGFVGLGNMGRGMVNNLLHKRQTDGKSKMPEKVEVFAFDIDPTAIDRVAKLGATPCQSLDEVVDRSEAIITMLPNNDIVRETVGQCLSSSKLKKDTLFLDSSTIDPDVSRQVARMCTEHQCQFVDSPVSGGVPGAEAGTLTFMVGAESPALFAKAESILDPMGRMLTHCGGVGSGQAAKLCNNMLLAISMVGVCESMNLGKRLGLDSRQLSEILCASTGRCWSVDSYNPVPGIIDSVPSSNGYANGFNIQLVAKDLGLAQDAANRVRALTPLGAQVSQIYRTLSNDDRFKDLDFAAVYKYFRMDVGDVK